MAINDKSSTPSIMLRKIFLIAIVFFVFLYLYFGTSGKWNGIPFYQLFLQLLFAFASYFYISNYKIIRADRIFILTFSFQFVFALLLKIMYVINAETEFGPSAVDSLDYFEFAQKGTRMDYRQFQNYLSDTAWAGIDDKGYLLYLRFLFILFPNDVVVYIVILLNAFFIAIGSVALYKTLIYLDPKNKRNAIAVTSIFSSFLTFVNTSAGGVKEDIFIPIIILAIYYFVSYRRKKKLKNLILVLLFSFLTVFFRTAITASLILVFAVGFISSRNNKKLLIYVFFISIIAFPIVVDFILTNFLGISLETVLSIAERRNERTTGADASSKMIGNVLASIIGPFPTFVDSHDTMFYSFSSTIKMILNFPVLCAIVRIMKNFDYKYYFVSFLYLIGILFNIVAGTGLDMRYQMPFFGAFLLLLFYYLNNIKLKPIFLWEYSLVCFSIVFVYNSIK